MSDEPAIHVKGPMWYLRCDTCDAFKWFDFEATADDWDHVCVDDDLDTITFEIRVDYAIAKPPTFDASPWRSVNRNHLIELAEIVRDVQITGAEKGSIENGHERRRAREVEQLIKEAEDVAWHPHECPDCHGRYATTRGLTQHQRVCRMVRRPQPIRDEDA